MKKYDIFEKNTASFDGFSWFFAASIFLLQNHSPSHKLKTQIVKHTHARTPAEKTQCPFFSTKKLIFQIFQIVKIHLVFFESLFLDLYNFALKLISFN